jgi:hypothetical protein
VSSELLAAKNFFAGGPNSTMASATEFAHLGMSYFLARNCMYEQYIVAGFAGNLFFNS